MPRLPKKKTISKRATKKPVKNTQRNLLLARRKKIIEQIVKNKEKKHMDGSNFITSRGERPFAPTEKIEPVPIFEPIPSAAKRQELPPHYGDNHIYLMVRDSHWLYSYWEIQKNHQERCLVLLGGDWNQVRSILRVYDITEKKEPVLYFDITLQGLASHWYIQARPNRSFVVEIGLLHDDGRFIALARSNEQTTPRDGMSEIIDEQWMGIDFEKMYALSGGFEVGKSSLELKKLMEKRLMGAISSGSGGGRR